MRCLEIVAELKFLQPIPDYSLDIDCLQHIAAFVQAEDSPDRAVQSLESFRRALVRLMREALRHEPGCVATDQPYVDVTVEAGEECGEPRWKIDAHVRIDESGSCTLRVGVDEAESDVSVFETPEEALAAVKAVLDRETARWTTFVSFKRKRPRR